MKDLRRFVLLISAEATGRICAFVLGALVARHYGLLVLAYVTLAQSIIAYATIVSDGGLNTAAVRRLAKGEDRLLTVSSTAQVQLFLACVGTLGVCLVTYIWKPDLLPYVLVSALVPLATALSTPYVLRADERITPIAVSRTIGGLATGLFGLSLVALDVVPYLLVLAYGLANVVMLIIVNWSSGVHPRMLWSFVPLPLQRRTISFVKTLGVNALLVCALASAPIIAASAADRSVVLEAVGVSVRLQFILAAPAAMLETIFLSALMRNGGALFKKLTASALACSLPLATAAAFFAEDYVPLLFGPDASTASSTVSHFALALPFTYIAAVGVLGMMAAHLDRWLPLATGGSLLSFIFFCLVTDVDEAIDVANAWLFCQIVLALITQGISWRNAGRGRESKAT